MRLLPASLLLVGAIGIVAGGCSDPKPADNALNFCARQAQAMCQIAAACKVDEIGCQMYQNQKCVTFAVDVTTPGTRQYNSDNANTCIARLNGAFGGGAGMVDYAQIGDYTDACERVFLGMAGVNAPCTLDYDCSNGLVCAPNAPGGGSVCVTPQFVGQGQSCAAPGSQCGADFYCAYQQGGGLACAPANASGAKCIDGSCSATDHCVAGICKARGSAGAQCVQDTDCAQDAPYCDPYANACSAGLTFTPGGIDCMGVAGVSTPRATTDGGGTGIRDGGGGS